MPHLRMAAWQAKQGQAFSMMKAISRSPAMGSPSLGVDSGLMAGKCPCALLPVWQKGLSQPERPEQKQSMSRVQRAVWAQLQ